MYRVLLLITFLILSINVDWTLCDDQQAAAAAGVANDEPMHVGSFAENCFRGYPVGEVFHYDFVTDLYFEKSHTQTDEIRRTHRRDLKAELSARLTPVADDDSSAIHVRLDIDHAHILDLEGWSAYDGDGESAAVDSTAADAQLLELLQKDFYYTQHCNMEINNVHYPEDEQKFAINLKSQLIKSFSHQLLAKSTYHQMEQDTLGEVRMEYSHEATDDGAGVHVTVQHNAARPVDMKVKGITNDGDRHQVDLDQSSRKRSLIRDGVVHSIELLQEHEFPGKNTRDEMARQAQEAETYNHAEADNMQDNSHTVADHRDVRDERYAASSNGFRMRSGGTTKVVLKAQRKRRVPQAEPTKVSGFRQYANVRHGDTIRFVTRRPHSLVYDADSHERIRSASDHGAPLDELARATADKEGNAHAAWRTLLHRLESPERDATLAGIRRMLSAESEEDDLLDEEDELPEEARQHLMSLLGEHGGAEQEVLLLEVALSSEDRSTDRHAAMNALSRLEEPSVELTTAIEAVIQHCDLKNTLCRQLLMVYGAMASTLHHAKQAQRAHDMRELIFVRLDERTSAQDPAGATVMAIALNNTMAFVDTDDEQLYNVTVGKWLGNAWGEGARSHLFDGTFLGERYWPDDPQLRKRSTQPLAPDLSLDAILGGKSGTSGWKKWYEGWSTSSLKNEYLPNGGVDQNGDQWAYPGLDDAADLPKFGLNGLDVNGKGKDKGFLDRCSGTYKDGEPCSSKHYDNWAPRNPDKGFKKKLGSGKFYAMIEAALHYRASGKKDKKLFYFDLDFFAGAQFSGSLMGKKVPILSAYARANISISDEREKCSYFDVGLFYYYFGKMFFWGLNTGDCQYVDSTCKPWFPVDRSQQGYIEFAHEVFFEMTFTFALGPIPMVVFIEGVGGAGMYWSIDMIFAPALKDKYGNECGGIDDGGGSMINGFCEPEAYISLAAELGIGVPVFSVGIGIQVTIIRVSFPASAGLNFITQRPCFGLGVSVGALGGNIYLWARIGLCKGWVKICIKLKKVIYDWKGLLWEKPLLRVDCCEPCPGACNNAWCDYKQGKCICNDGWGGKLCNMECPLGCKDIETINRGVKCEINPDPNSHGELCECKEGFYGWNCLVPCPGIRETDPMPHAICSGHGVCGDFGYQSSTGFGINNEIENTLTTACSCEHNWFGERCDITCPPDEETGKVCGGAGGVCVFDGVEASCQCLKGYAGPNCEARCPLFRGSPCGFRGDCLWEDGRATCHCEKGFSGVGCEHADGRGGGRALNFHAEDKYYAEIDDNNKIYSRDKQYTFGLWFKVDELPQGDATLLTWKNGRIMLLLDAVTKRAETATLAFCDARSVRERDGCVLSPTPIVVGDGEWHFVFVTTAIYELAHDKQLWHGSMYKGGCKTGATRQPAPYDDWCMADASNHENSEFGTVKGTFRLAMNFTGQIDNVQVFGVRPTTVLVNEFAHHTQSPDDPHVLYNALCDEGRGDVFLDEKQMLSGRFVFTNDMDWVAKGPEYFWANPSGMTLLSGALYSNATDTFKIGNGTVERQWFKLDLRAARIQAAELHFSWAVSAEQLCEVEVTLFATDGNEKLNIKDENGNNKRFNGEGDEVVALTSTQVGKVRTITALEFKTGVDSVNGGPCEVVLDEVYLEATSPVVDQTLEFTGRPSAFAGTVRHKPLKLPFTIEMWLIRPPLLHSRRGLLLALVDRNADDSLANIDGPFLLYETGFPKLGMQYLYNGKSQKVLAGGHDDAYRYQVPSGEWVHLAITVEPSQKAGHCLHTFYINGETGRLRGIGDGTGYGEVLDYPGLMSSVNQGLKPNYCDPTAALQGWGDGRFELRVGPRFLGAINDVLIWDRAVSATELRRSLHQYRPLVSTLALHAYDFANIGLGGEKNQPVMVPDLKGGATLEMRDGAHVGLLVAVQHQWEHCPGVTYQTPEAICGSEPSHAHGTCFKPRGTRDQRDEVDSEREKGFECECHAGYVQGLSESCTIECPGGFKNPCSGHGRCVGAIAPIEAWEASDGTVNDSYVNPDDPNVDDTRQSEQVSCVCDEGYVGPACQYECPGWTATWNRPQRLCAGYGYCNYTESGSAVCVCFDTSQRYGDACEYAYGSKPDKVVSQCGPCDGLNEEVSDRTVLLIG